MEKYKNALRDEFVLAQKEIDELEEDRKPSLQAVYAGVFIGIQIIASRDPEITSNEFDEIAKLVDEYQNLIFKR